MAVFNTRYPNAGSPLAIAELRKKLGRDNALFHYLKHFALRDVVYQRFDFTEDTLNADPWAVAAGGGATTWAITVAEDGWLRGVTGATAATSGLQLYTPALFYGARNPGFEIGYKTSAIDEFRLEVGFVNALPSVNTTIVNSLVTPTFNTTADAAVYVYNHTGSTTTSGLYAIDSTATTGDAEKAATTSNRPVNDTGQRVRVQVIGASAYLWVDGQYLGSIASALKSSVAMLFAVSLKSNADSNSQNGDIDYIELWKDRAW